MHELGVAQQMMSLALEYANQNNAAQIKQFSIGMSQSADESEDSLRFHLETLTHGTPAAGAQFEIKRVPVHLHCLECGHEYAQSHPGEACPECHSARVMPTLHHEFKLVSIEVE